MKSATKGSWYQMPRKVHRCADYRCLSGSAVKLLNALTYQFRGKNNGDLTAAYSVMQEQHGFNSNNTVLNAVTELIDANLVVKSRQGGLGRCSLFALAWLKIDECNGKMLEIQPTTLPIRRIWNQTELTQPPVKAKKKAIV